LKELSKAEKQLAAAEKFPEEIRSKKSKLESESKRKISQMNSESDSIIDSMFN
jgi:hypothetical protein